MQETHVSKMLQEAYLSRCNKILKIGEFSQTSVDMGIPLKKTNGCNFRHQIPNLLDNTPAKKASRLK